MTDELRQAMAALGAGAPHASSTNPGATSDLSIDEALLLHSIGWEPVDLVFGVGWWSIPWGAFQTWQAGEVTAASDAFGGAMREASEQLRHESARAGGAGVVGVEIDISVHSHHVDVTLTGTAVRRIGEKPSGDEFLSDLSARDFSLLIRAGWVPRGLVAGASFVIAPRRSARQWAAQKGQNVELPNLTEALYLARERAMDSMQQMGLGLHADGVVNVKLREGPLGHNPRIIQFVAVGTAVKLADSGHRSVEPMMVVPLDDPVLAFEAASLRAKPGS